MFRTLDDGLLVAPQISADAVAAAAAQGVTLIINNRPDGEEAGQPSGDVIRAAAEAAGIGYVAIPVGHAGFSHPQIAAMQAALAGADGPVLAYCRSGTRSTFLWALARAQAGDPVDAIAGKAAAAGYDVASIAPMLQALAAR
ncbi:TIGR01244 family sulfur transferase [Sphingomonas flavalba]|uniref:TIGR01244 family sulfur transferase n=1 Tax=Sphingomonas flavalba TaxID=2559804 RepID=UPI0019D0CD86|nr:TIGR01244 family sulfur transferase [Sphingomonas flavalba]